MRWKESFTRGFSALSSPRAFVIAEQSKIDTMEATVVQKDIEDELTKIVCNYTQGFLHNRESDFALDYVQKVNKHGHNVVPAQKGLFSRLCSASVVTFEAEKLQDDAWSNARQPLLLASNIALRHGDTQTQVFENAKIHHALMDEIYKSLLTSQYESVDQLLDLYVYDPTAELPHK